MDLFNHRSGDYFTRGDAEIYYEETGNADQPVLLLLHGGFGNIEDFNPILSSLKHTYRIIGIDSRGQGKSTMGNASLTYQLLQQDVEALLKSLNINELNIFGISDGGVVAYRMASLSSLKIDKLVTIGSRWHSQNAIDTKDVLSSVTADFWKEKHPGMVDMYNRLNPAPNLEKLVEQLVAMWLNQNGYPNESVKNIAAKTLIVRGDKDNLTLRKFICELADTIPNANLANIAFASHVVYTEELEVLMTFVNEFLKQ